MLAAKGRAMKRIFISYRSSDGRKDANRLAEDLSMVFGDEQVFYDKRDLQGGSSWREVIDAAIGAKPVVLLVLSPDFFGARHSDGRRRLDDDDDPVRQELAFALQSRATVMPLRGEGVEMPPDETLPPELRAVTERHAPRLRTEDWRQDFQRLVDDLIHLGLEPARDDWRSLFGGTPPPRSRRWWFGAALGLAALAGLGTLGYFAGEAGAPSADRPDPGRVPVTSARPPSAGTAAKSHAAPASTVERTPTEACRDASPLDVSCIWRQCNRRAEFAQAPECIKLREEQDRKTNLSN